MNVGENRAGLCLRRIRSSFDKLRTNGETGGNSPPPLSAPSSQRPALGTQHSALSTQHWFFLSLSLLALLATAWPDSLALLRYDRTALAHGELWRIVTGHLTHLGWAHLALDLLGLALICELLWGDLPLRHGIGLLCFSAVAISAGLWWLQPGLAWYAGLSGVLCGLWAGCALRGLPGRIHAAALLLLAAKLALEFFYGATPETARLIGGNVVTAAHLYGALAGVVYAIFISRDHRANNLVWSVGLPRYRTVCARPSHPRPIWKWNYMLALHRAKIRPLSEGRCDRIPRPGSEAASSP